MAKHPHKKNMINLKKHSDNLDLNHIVKAKKLVRNLDEATASPLYKKISAIKTEIDREYDAFFSKPYSERGTLEKFEKELKQMIGSLKEDFTSYPSTYKFIDKMSRTRAVDPVTAIDNIGAKFIRESFEIDKDILKEFEKKFQDKIGICEREK